MFEEIREVQGSIFSGENANALWYRVTYKCPYCAKRHIQKGRQSGTIDDMRRDGGIFVEPRCNQAVGVKVQPYR